MKKIIAILLVVCTLFASVSVVSADSAPEKMYIFVKVGAEDGDGSKDNPYGTFNEARDAIREIKKNGEYPEGGIVVYFREGVYPISETMTLMPEDSGEENAPIVYRAYMEEQVSFVGGVELPVKDFKPVTDPAALERTKDSAEKNILCANLKEDFGITEYGELNMYGMGLGYFTNAVTNMAGHGVHIPAEQPPELFFGNDSGIIAKYPNEDWIYTGSILQTGDEVQWWSSTWLTSEQFVPEEERIYPPKPSIWMTDGTTANVMSKWKNEDDIWVYGTFGENWSDNSLPVQEIDYSKGIITTKFPSPKLIKTNMKYYIYNVLGELDMPGEYYLDRNTGVLYIYPKDLNGTVTFSNLKTRLLELKGVENVSFKSVAFKGSLAQLAQVQGCINVTFELCTFSKSAKSGIGISGGRDCKLISCRIYQMGNGGVSVGTGGGSYHPEIDTDADQNLVPQNHVVENCEISNTGRINATYSPNLTLSGVGNVARNNKIHDGEHMAVSLGGNDNTLEYNEFTDLLRSADDSGLIYAGYALERQGYVIRHNYFHDIVSSSTKANDISMWYPDDTMRGWTVQSNLIVNTSGRGMHSNGGATHTVTDNIAIDLGGQFLNFGWHETDLAGKYAWEKYNFQKYLDNPAYAKYKNFADITPENYLHANDITTDRNVIWNATGDITGPAFTAHKDENNFNPSYQISSDPGFVDMANGDYTLREDSIIYKKFPDFQAPDFRNMGMYTGRLQGLLGNSLALLVGSPKAYNGWNPEEINPRHDAAPLMKDGVAYLPVRYITEALGGEVAYNEETAEVTVTYTTPVVITKEEYVEINGSSFIPADRIAEIFDREVKVFDNEVIVIGEEVRIPETDIKVLDELHRRLYNE